LGPPLPPQARELKSVYLRTRGTFLKLLLHKCYINPSNLFNQIGLIAVNVLGLPANAPPAPTLAGGVRAPVPGAARPGPGVHDLAVDMGMDPETATLLREVVARKEGAVAAEEFELAKRLKALQDGIRRVGGTLASLAADKSKAVEEEDYDRAARVKEEMGRIRSAIYDQMAELGMGGSSSGGQRGGGESEGGGRALPPPAYGGRSAPPPSVAFDPLYGGGSAEAPTPVGQTLAASLRGGGGGDGYFNAPGSSDRPIRPAHLDIYARAEGTAPQPDPASPQGRYGDARPASRAIHPARNGAIRDAMDAEGGGGVTGGGDNGGREKEDKTESPFGKRAGAAASVPVERADPSALKGVAGAADLPAPDPFPMGPGGDRLIAAPLSDIFGEYVARCYLSKAWSLREASMSKMALDMGKVAEDHGGAKAEVLIAVAAAVANLLQKDKNTNVLIAACATLIPSLTAVVCVGADAARRSEVFSSLDPVLTALVDKLGDNAVKVREAAVQALLALSVPEALGVAHVGAALLRKPGKKQAGNLRGTQSRLEVLALLIESRGMLATGGCTSADSLVAFWCVPAACVPRRPPHPLSPSPCPLSCLQRGAVHLWSRERRHPARDPGTNGASRAGGGRRGDRASARPTAAQEAERGVYGRVCGGRRERRRRCPSTCARGGGGRRRTGQGQGQEEGGEGRQGQEGGQGCGGGACSSSTRG